MNAAPSTVQRIGTAVAALGPGPLTEATVREHVAPLFSRTLSRRPAHSYLANHSLGRPLDATDADLREALDAWFERGSGAWQAWSDELEAFRARLAALTGAQRNDCIVPKTSAGAGLRAVLNTFAHRASVVSTTGEFDSLDVILRDYRRRGRIELALVRSRHAELFDTGDILAAIVPGIDLVVLSQVMFRTGQLIDGLDEIVARAHAAGARVLLDIYHSLGVVPLDLAALDVDYAVGGSYKYLRGGPGAAFLLVSAAQLDAGEGTPDIGWFAKEAPFRYERPEPPRFAAGGDGWLESTPPVLTWYQARAGQLFTQAVGVARLRSYSQSQQCKLVGMLAAKGITAHGGTADRGAFAIVEREDAQRLATALLGQGIETDARGSHLRICPDLLTTDEEIEGVVAALSGCCAR